MFSGKSSVLIVGPSWVGDMVMAQSLFISLKQKNPDLAIDVLAPRWSLPILERMQEVRDGIALDVGHGQLGWLTRYRLGKSLRCKAYDYAIVLPRSIKSALVPFFAAIPKRIGFRGEHRYGLLTEMRRLDKQRLDQTVKRFVSLGLSLENQHGLICPEPRLEVDKQHQQSLMSSLGLSKNKKVVGIMPGAEYGQAKQWPTEYYAKLTARLSQQGIQVWIFGSAKEQALAESIYQLADGQGINLCGKTKLEDAIDLIAAVDVAVSNDSGLMHVSAALQRPLLAIYGSSDPLFTPPLIKGAQIMYQNLECSPCFQRTCPYGHYNCLREISVDNVLAKINGMIKS